MLLPQYIELLTIRKLFPCSKHTKGTLYLVNILLDYLSRG